MGPKPDFRIEISRSLRRKTWIEGSFWPGGLASTVGFLVALFLEVGAIASPSRAKDNETWASEVIPTDRLTDVTATLVAADVEEWVGFSPEYLTAAVGRLRDGSRIRRIGAVQGDSTIMIVLHHLPKSGNRIVDSLVLHYEGNAVTGAKLRAGGKTRTTMSSPSAASNGPCTCWNAVCTGVDKGFADCCWQCAMSLIAGPAAAVACALIWCSWCLIEHCNRYIYVCNC